MQIITMVISLAATTTVGIIGYFIKKNHAGLERKDEDQQAAIDAIKTQISENRLEAQREFVTKDEFIRAVSGQDRKLDKIYDEVIKLSKNNNNHGG